MTTAAGRSSVHHVPRSRLWKVSVENYLSFRKAEVELQPLSVLVGPNGAGKSNFLDVIRFVGDVARYDISGAFDRRGGFDQVRLHHQLALRNSIKITIEASATAHSSSAAGARARRFDALRSSSSSE